MSEPVNHEKGDFYIDVHAHVLPGFYLDALREVGINDIDGWPFPDWSVETALKAMDQYKIKTQVLSLSSPGVDFVSGAKAAQLARRLNEFQAKLVEDHAPRFGSLAVLPLPDVEASLAEISYAFDTLGMDGVGLLSNYHGLYLGDPKIDAVFAELDRRKAAVLVHPTEPPNFKTFNIGLSAPVQEFVFDSTRMAQNLVQTGTKAKYPDITIIVAHGGGTLPYTGQRLVKYAMNGKNAIFNTFAYELTATTEPGQIRALMATPFRVCEAFPALVDERCIGWDRVCMACGSGAVRAAGAGGRDGAHGAGARVACGLGGRGVRGAPPEAVFA